MVHTHPVWGLPSASQQPAMRTGPLHNQRPQGPGDLHIETPALSLEKMVGLCHQVDGQAPSGVCRCRKSCSSPLVKNAQMLVKKTPLWIVLFASVYYQTPLRGSQGRSCGAWEFPSTKAVLPLFVTPQRTSGSIAPDPYLTLSPVCLPHCRQIPLPAFEGAERFQTWVVCGHPQVHMQNRLCVCECWWRR